jgi:hypothetical protein
LGCVWVYFFLPETARRSLEEIDYMFLHHVPARDFSSFRVPDLPNAEAVLADKNLEEKAPYVAVHLDGRV